MGHRGLITTATAERSPHQTAAPSRAMAIAPMVNNPKADHLTAASTEGSESRSAMTIWPASSAVASVSSTRTIFMAVPSGRPDGVPVSCIAP